LFKRITPLVMSPWSIHVSIICPMRLTSLCGGAAQPDCEVHPMMVHNEPNRFQYARLSALANEDHHYESN
jgi:hypothetical protein